jgi:hypothetical protein
VITLDNSRDEATAPNARESERRARAPRVPACHTEARPSRSALALPASRFYVLAAQVREAPLSVGGPRRN